MRTEEDHFADWEAHVFGFGYGTGETHVLAALKGFMDCIGRNRGPDLQHSYDYEVLEEALTPAVAWLLINTLCHADIIEYGTSPRYGWLTVEGQRLKAFIDARTVEELVACTDRDSDDVLCFPDGCNCWPDGYRPEKRCHNPFWKETRSSLPLQK